MYSIRPSVHQLLSTRKSYKFCRSNNSAKYMKHGAKIQLSPGFFRGSKKIGRLVVKQITCIMIIMKYFIPRPRRMTYKYVKREEKWSKTVRSSKRKWYTLAILSNLNLLQSNAPVLDDMIQLKCPFFVFFQHTLFKLWVQQLAFTFPKPFHRGFVIWINIPAFKLKEAKVQ